MPPGVPPPTPPGGGPKTTPLKVWGVEKGVEKRALFHDRQIVISRPPRNARFSRGARFGQWSKFFESPNRPPKLGLKLAPLTGTPPPSFSRHPVRANSSRDNTLSFITYPLFFGSFPTSAGRSWISGAYHVPSPSQPRSSNIFRKDPNLSTFWL